MKPLQLALAAVLLAAPALAAFAPGGTAYTKRVETKLLAEPNPLAATAARVGYARKLQIDETRGTWLRVSDGAKRGWVFSGNLAEQKPEEVRGLDGLPVAASETTATAAARPLAPAAVDYAARRGLTQARGDVEWLEQTSAAITADEVQAYMQAQKKGEFQ
jgi:hypothetical protein